MTEWMNEVRRLIVKSDGEDFNNHMNFYVQICNKCGKSFQIYVKNAFTI